MAIAKQDRDRLKDLKAKARLAVLPEAEKAKREWIEAYVGAGPDKEQRRAEAHAALYGNTLGPDFILYPEDGEPVPVSELKADPARWNRTRFADPLEPDYRHDRRISVFIADKGGSAYIYSHAHGGRIFRLGEHRKEILIKAGETHDATTETINILREHSDLCDYGSQLARVVDKQIFTISSEAFRDVVNEYVQFYKINSRNERIKVDTPKELGDRVVNTRRFRRHFPKITQVITAPILRSDGSLLDRPGLDPVTGLYLVGMPPDWHGMNPVPTIAGVRKSVAALWQPFQHFEMNAISRGVLLALLLTAVVRPSLPTAPAGVFEAPTFGSGKTLLASCVARLGGHDVHATPPPDNDEAFKKLFFSALLAGTGVFLSDNWTQPLDGKRFAGISMALTSPTFKDRKPGVSEVAELPSQVLFLITGNNTSVRNDLVRRCLVCRIEPRHETPERRAFPFDPEAMVQDNRLTLVSHALTILLGFQTHGKPLVNAPAPLGKFEAWDAMVRQCVVWIARDLGVYVGADGLDGFSDPLDSMSLNALADPGRGRLGRLLLACVQVFESRTFTAAEVLEIVNGYGDSSDAREALQREVDSMTQDGYGGPMTSIRLGRYFSSQRGVIVDGMCLHSERDTHANSDRWRVLIA